MKKFYCSILKHSFAIDYNSKGLNQFNCPNSFINSNEEMFCDDVKYKKCPVHNLLDRVAKIDVKVLDELIKG